MVTRCPKRRFQFLLRAELADTLARCWRVLDIPVISILGQRSLFVTQRRYRIDTHGAACRDQAGGKRHQDQ
jgi:hypothetical protein